MILKRVHAKNFLSIVDECLLLDSMTVLVGTNGSGKSAFLTAIDCFFAGSYKASAEDLHRGVTADDIEITLTFGDLSSEAATDFARYVAGGEFSVTRVFSLSNLTISGKYFGSTAQHAGFSQIRATGAALDKRRIYKELQERTEYSDLSLSPFLCHA